jgi:hypothetical protein
MDDCMLLTIGHPAGELANYPGVNRPVAEDVLSFDRNMPRAPLGAPVLGPQNSQPASSARKPGPNEGQIWQREKVEEYEARCLPR